MGRWPQGNKDVSGRPQVLKNREAREKADAAKRNLIERYKDVNRPPKGAPGTRRRLERNAIVLTASRYDALAAA